MISAVPLPRRPPAPDTSPMGDGFTSHVRAGAVRAGDICAGPDARARHWYENDLGWPTVPGRPLRLLTGVRFDVLDVPAEAGAQALRHLAPGSPVILRGDRMELLVAPGSAEELPGLLDWLEWGAVPLDLRVLGQGGALEAPPPPVGAAAVRLTSARPDSPGWPDSLRVRPGSTESARGRSVQGAVAGVWLRPPGPGGEVGHSLPAMPGVPAGPGAGREGSAPDLVRLVDTMAAQCHRVRLRRDRAGDPADRRNQPLAFS
ncbi:SCO3374 family protein [Streptomyces rameus]|uniref:SCO3374 family protein n=2 Tax=Streptomyces rameus TaxID=68261 RepID=A0ABP6NH05_9ACTN